MSYFNRHSLYFTLPLAICFILWFYIMFIPIVTQPEGVIQEITPRMSKRAWVEELKKQGIVKHTVFVLLYAYLHPTSELKAGEYLFKKGASTAQLFRQVTVGTGLYYRAFTIVPGMTFKKLRQSLADTAALKQTLPSLTDAELMTALGEPGINPEGMFLPETYHYAKGVSDQVILRQARDLMKKTLDAAWETRSPNLPFNTSYDALIAASLVQNEAYLPEEKPIIAGVLINRLQKNMRLQFDPTVIYGLGDAYRGQITREDLHADTPYNTYLHAGLPPTPIGMPDKLTIAATLQPSVHDYLYFVAKGKGAHQFSATLEAHKEAVKQWMQMPESHALRQVEFFNSVRVTNDITHVLPQLQLSDT